MRVIRLRKGKGPKFRLGRFYCIICLGRLSMYNLGTQCFCHAYTKNLNSDMKKKELEHLKVLRKLIGGFKRPPKRLEDI